MPDSTALPGQSARLGASLAAIGIVYGDLGTSPLYAYQSILPVLGGRIAAEDALGLLSVVVWALLVSVSLKYGVLVLRADNHGEGGTLALMALIRSRVGAGWIAVAGVFGAALIYGDGIITPAISVLSALEGMNVVTDRLAPLVLPGTLLILAALFALQPRGTARIGALFGPVMVLWFLAAGALGLASAWHHPELLRALDPGRAIGFLARQGWRALPVLGGVVLAITGAEAMYADLGHIGRAPIRLAWFALVLPALLLSYAGQSALLLDKPTLQGNPFFHQAPGWALLPMVILATLATIIASQSIITGAFSLTRQAMQLGWMPGLRIRQTSSEAYGQIYVPLVNWVMMAGTLALAFGFGSSDRLAGAYGTAVSTTMLLTTLLLGVAMRRLWGWNLALVALACLLFLAFDIPFFVANLLKIAEGGWIPLLIAAVLYALMGSWRRGTQALHAKLAQGAQTPRQFLDQLRQDAVARVPGAVVFLSRGSDVIPPLMACQARQFHALPRIMVCLTVHFEEVPRIAAATRATVTPVGDGLWLIGLRYGFVEIPRLGTDLAATSAQGCPIDPEDVVYVAAHDEVVRGPKPRLPAWRRLLFAAMLRNAVRAPDRFDLPPARFVSIGRQVEL